MRRLCVALIVPTLAGCFMVGPDYRRPDAPTAAEWIEQNAADTPLVATESDIHAWWSFFHDPVLDDLVEAARRQNPNVRTAGAHVLEALAQRGIAIGTLFPQTQEGFAGFERDHLSQNRANQHTNFGEHSFNAWTLGFDAAWELDVWGKIRRNIETADATVLASIATYDDVLVSLVAEVASNYIAHRTLEERLVVARNNVDIQTKSYQVAEDKFRGGLTSQLDALQAASLLEDTRTLIPQIEAGLRQSENNLCLLLGIPPRDLGALLGSEHVLPTAPATLALGIPADLLRRRPDVRRAERTLAAQSAQIGVAKADLFPAFSLTGSLGFGAESFVDLFEGRSFEAFGGPQVRWAILNYGRIASNVRVQDARYQALVSDYENTVLRAQTEVENALAAFLRAEREVTLLGRSVDSASRAVDVADVQYREGAADYTRVLNTQQTLVAVQDRLVFARGDVGQALVSIYKALGGGWEPVTGGYVDDEERRAMEARTRWGETITPQGQEHQVEAASTGTEHDTGWWRWRWWWPKW